MPGAVRTRGDGFVFSGKPDVLALVFETEKITALAVIDPSFLDDRGLGEESVFQVSP